MVSAYLEKTAPLRPEDAITGNMGKAFKIDCWTRLDRFLILGAESNTIYATQPDILASNTDALNECLTLDPARTISRIIEISVSGRAPKNEPALYALAKAASHSDVTVRRAALTSAATGRWPLNEVARTGTHLEHFMAYLMAQPAIEPRAATNRRTRDGERLSEQQRSKKTRGVGRLVREALDCWFSDKTVDALAYQAVKYQSRDGWALRDVLRLARTSPGRDPKRRALYHWMDRGVGDEFSGHEDMPDIIRGFEAIRRTDNSALAIGLIRGHNLPREAIPTQLLNDPDVWNTLLQEGSGMPITAMIRNLGKMTSIGLVSQNSAAEKFVVNRLTDPSVLKKGRVHPITLLNALRVYEQGRGLRGKLSWSPTKGILYALDVAFYEAFRTIEPSGKRIRLAVDVSGSMWRATVNGMEGLDAATAAGAMALVTIATEPNTEALAYSCYLTPLKIRPSMRLDEVMRVMAGFPHQATHCRLPIEDALDKRLEFDAFVSYTDSETGDGGGSYGYASSNRGINTANKALLAYRNMSGIQARHAVVAFSANEISVAHPDDPLQMDFVGLDSAGPAILSDFIAGRL